MRVPKSLVAMIGVGFSNEPILTSAKNVSAGVALLDSKGRMKLIFG
jgi:hypothetical protein